LGRFDVVVSSLAIHHLTDATKKISIVKYLLSLDKEEFFATLIMLHQILTNYECNLGEPWVKDCDAKSMKQD
jgi:hypothetical protein